MMKSVLPIIKWAGGKRWLVNKYRYIFPNNFNRLVEPFLGGASVFLSLAPKRALLVDINSELITTYLAIRDNWQLVLEGLKQYQKVHNKEHFYNVRSESPNNPIDIAIRFLYLNRTCWNGLYRVNKKGEFNVPIGTKNQVLLPSDDFESLSQLLKKEVILQSQSFKETLQQVQRDDFIYVDPPYIVNHDKNGFLKYNESIFAWKDQVLLRDEIENIALKGSKIIISQSNHQSIRDLYKDFGKNLVLNRHSVLSSKREFRKSVQELIISINC